MPCAVIESDLISKGALQVPTELFGVLKQMQGQEVVEK